MNTKIILGDKRNEKEFLGMTFLDMHNHSKFSDGSHTPERLIEESKLLNCGFCLTDHDEIRGSLKVCKEVLSIPSMELTSSNFHDFLVYFNSEKDGKEFYEKKVANKRIGRDFINAWRLKYTNEELIDEMKRYNCLVALAHPYTYWPKKSQPFFSKKENQYLLKKIDAIEGINGMHHNKANNNSLKWANEINKPIIGGSDSHTYRNLCNVLTGSFADSRTEFLENIRNGKNCIMVRRKRFEFTRLMFGSKVAFNNLSLYRKPKKI